MMRICMKISIRGRRDGRGEVEVPKNSRHYGYFIESGQVPGCGSVFWGVPIAAERDYSAKSAVCTGREVAGGEFPLPGQLLLYL